MSNQTKVLTAEQQNALTREYLTEKADKARAAIAFAVPGADLSYAKATLNAVEMKLAVLAQSGVA